MTNYIYKPRAPYDSISYVSQKDLLERVGQRRDFCRMIARQADVDSLLFNYPGLSKKDIYAISFSGKLMDISPYKTEMYTHYDGNNPALIQGGEVVISSRVLYGPTIDRQYKQAVDPSYIRSRVQKAKWVNPKYIEKD